MEKSLEILKGTQLFAGVSPDELTSILGCLAAQRRDYAKGALIFHSGQTISQLAVVLSGSVLVQSDDYWGNRTIINQLGPGDLFGEAYVAPTSGPIQHDVVAASDCAVMFFEARKVLTVCSSACRFHSLVIQNLFYVLSDKNRTLVTKLDHLAKRSTRAKLISYLSAESKRQQSASFTIPFNRQELADFLSVDRSAMSSELSKMHADGLLDFERNHFTLHH